MPAGFKEDSSAAANSAGASPSDSPEPPVTHAEASKFCPTLTNTAFFAEVGRPAPSVGARNAYSDSTQTNNISQEIDIFTGNDAHAFLENLWQDFGLCPSFLATSQGQSYNFTLTRSRLTGIGDEAIKAVISDPAVPGGDTFVAVRVGTAVITVGYYSDSPDLGAPAADYAARLAKNVAAALPKT